MRRAGRPAAVSSSGRRLRGLLRIARQNAFDRFALRQRVQAFDEFDFQLCVHQSTTFGDSLRARAATARACSCLTAPSLLPSGARHFLNGQVRSKAEA